MNSEEKKQSHIIQHKKGTRHYITLLISVFAPLLPLIIVRFGYESEVTHRYALIGVIIGFLAIFWAVRPWYNFLALSVTCLVAGVRLYYLYRFPIAPMLAYSTIGTCGLLIYAIYKIYHWENIMENWGEIILLLLIIGIMISFLYTNFQLLVIRLPLLSKQILRLVVLEILNLAIPGGLSYIIFFQANTLEQKLFSPLKKEMLNETQQEIQSQKSLKLQWIGLFLLAFTCVASGIIWWQLMALIY